RSRPPHLRSWRDGWRHLRFLLMYSPRWLFLYPGALLMLVGMLAGLWLLPGPRFVGGVALDVNTMLYAAAAIFIGFQSVVFWTFTKTFAISAKLLPPDPRMDKLYRIFPLEAGLIVGGVMTLLGLAGSIYAVSDWGQHAFGELNPQSALRIVIPSVLSLVLGCQL